MQWTVPSAIDYFATLVADDEAFPLTEAAIAVAQAEYPALDVQGVLAELDLLAQRLRRKVAGEDRPVHRLQILHGFFFDELAFAGNPNDFYSPRNSYVHEVLRTRRGIPITLAVIYLELAGQIGLVASGVSFPGHFLVRVRLPSGDAVVDPLTGQSLTREALEEWMSPYLEKQTTRPGAASSDSAELLRRLLVPSSAREIVARMLRNLESVHRAADDGVRRLQILQRLVVLLPNEPDWRRDRGLALADMGQTAAAIEDLSAYLRQARSAHDRAQVAARLGALRDVGPPRLH